MYRLLLVDDEPVIVNSMYQLFREAVHLELEMYKAYTVEEALDYLHQHRIDLVLSDIRMPGMNGMDLQKQIVSKWPRCKVIFLTGYDDFEYAKQAIRNGGVADYLLKHEDDDIILQSVEKALADIAKHTQFEDYELRTKTKLQLTVSAAQKNLLFELINGMIPSPDALAGKFAQLEMPLQADKPVYLLIGRVDGWSGSIKEADRTLLAFAIQNIVDEYLSSEAVCVSVIYEACRFIWLIQPANNSGMNLQNESQSDPQSYTHSDPQIGPEEQWNHLVSRIHGRVEDAQISCKKLLKVPVSFALSRERGDWSGLGTQFYYLRTLLGRGFDGEQELLIQEGHVFNGLDMEKNRRHFSGSQQLRKQLGVLEEYLESGQRQAFMALYEDIMDIDASYSHTHLLELFYSVSLCLLSYSNRTGVFHTLSAKMNVGKMTQFDAYDTWEEIATFFREFAGLLFDSRQDSPEVPTQRTIHFIQQYIQTHLEQELTLTKLSALVHHSPTYLSRLYKRVTGVTLFDYITECRMVKAREMLTGTVMKIHEIAAAVGYEAAPQFTRSFKKWLNVTPQEYRDTYSNLKLE